MPTAQPVPAQGTQTGPLAIGIQPDLVGELKRQSGTERATVA